MKLCILPLALAVRDLGSMPHHVCQDALYMGGAGSDNTKNFFLCSEAAISPLRSASCAGDTAQALLRFSGHSLAFGSRRLGSWQQEQSGASHSQFQVRVVVSALSSSKSPHQLRSLRKLKGAGAQATGLRPRMGA